MLNALSFTNYRAFRTGSIELRPLTILLGSNGVGKTSLMQLLLLLRQTKEAGGTGYRSPLRLQGRDVQFGDPVNIFFNHDIKKNIGIHLQGDVPEIHNDLKGRLMADFSDLIEEFSFYIYRSISLPGSNVDSSFEREFLEVRNSYAHRNQKGRRSRQGPRQILDLMNRYVAQADNSIGPQLPLFDATSIFSRRHIYRSHLFDGDKKTSIESLSHALSMLESMESIDANELTLSFQIGKQRGGPLLIREVKLSNSTKNIISVSARQSNKPSTVRSDVFSFPGNSFDLPTAANLIDQSATIFECITSKNDRSSDFRVELARHLLKTAIDSFAKTVTTDLVNHVPPLRAYPKRYYFLDYAISASGRDDSVVESLRENNTLKSAVNRWLNRFGISVSVSQVEELIHKLKVSKQGVGFELDIADVGFGISQILPVVVQCFLAKPTSFTVIEQPEIHLHPKMQADLADLFIEALDGDVGKKFVVETHSEYLLNRLRLRIAEGKISRDDVAIYFVEPTGTDPDHELGAYVRKIDVSYDGSFDWPVEFFESDLDDTISFLKLKSTEE